jgi:hypothetical protein
MGGGSGGGFSSSEAEQVEKAAEARLKAIASRSTRILFICEEEDRRSLDSHLARSTAFEKERVTVVDNTKTTAVDAVLDATTFLVAFTNETKAAPFIDGVIDKALVKKISGVHVKAQPRSLVPSKVGAYRWRSLTWQELEAIFSA